MRTLRRLSFLPWMPTPLPGLMLGLLLSLLWFTPARAEHTLNHELETVTLQLKWKHQFQFAGYYAAIVKGFYEDAGLRVLVREAQPGHKPMQEVLTGRAEFGVGTTDLVIDRSHGEPVVLLANIFQHSPLALVTLKERGIKNIKSLAGRKLMIEPHSAELYAYFKTAGLLPDTYDLVPHTFDIRDLTSGRVDAMSIYSTTEPFELEKQQTPYTLFKPLAAGIDFYGDNLFTMQDQISRFPDRTERFLAASLKGWQYAMAHQEEMIDIIIERFGSLRSREALAFEAKMMQPLISNTVVEIGYINPQRWQSITQTYLDAGMIPQAIDLEGFIFQRPKDAVKPWQIKLALGASIIAALALGLAFYVHRLNKDLRLSEERYRLLSENAHDVIWTMDRSGSLTYVSPSVERLRGFTVEEIRDQTIEQSYVGDSGRRAKEWLNTFVESGEMPRLHFEVEQPTKDGSRIWTQTSITVIKNIMGEGRSLLGITRDITERRRFTETLQTRFVALESAEDGVMITDRQGYIEYTNPKFLEMTGFTAEEVLGKTPRIQDSGQMNREFFKDLWQTVLMGQTWRGELINCRKDGSLYDEEMTISPVLDDEGQVMKFVSIKRNITRRKEMENKLRHMAHFDMLTDLPNRSLLFVHLQTALKNAKENNSPFALLFMDLDGFKVINDTLGHKTGDRLLETIARRLKGQVVKGETVARVGGDEFVFLLPEISTGDQALARATAIIESLSQPIVLQGKKHQVSASIGIALYPDHGNDQDTLLSNADKAMYQAKLEGRGKASLFGPPEQA